ncbi:hypothetical protein CVIRNUC_008594 [Coccomyxa viridis]|uniref:DJ-1/PfpI domain-containing protein n=1 Tax=Coccomyxa viridis TaxID=1274662 RepID=A0AAV1IDC8_9CHLO|nr:hypothetical protein CVIRNUC_008594 [Coccomyxa viridis]
MLACKQGFEVVIASTKGGKIPLDPTSLSETNLNGAAKAFQTNGAHLPAYRNYSLFWYQIRYPPLPGKSMEKLNNSLKASDANVDDYLAFYIPGGHGVMADGVQLMTPIIEKFAKKGKVCAAVCHGPAALTEAKLNGEYLVKGKKVTVFSNSEEVEVDKVNVVPFLPEDRMKERGAIFSKGDNWTEHVVVDGKLITGQNPQSSEALGEAIAKVLGA